MTDVPDNRTAETIATYDVIAHRYAVRFAVSDQPRHRADFCALLPAGAVVIDAGCGPGLGCRRLAAAGMSTIGLDLSAGMLVEAGLITSAPLVRSDMGRLPVRDESVAGIWCDAALVHLDRASVVRVLDEFARVLPPTGALFVSLCVGTGRDWRTGPDGHRRWFCDHDETWFRKRLRLAGFDELTCDTSTEREATWLSVLARRTAPAGRGALGAGGAPAASSGLSRRP